MPVSLSRISAVWLGSVVASSAVTTGSFASHIKGLFSLGGVISLLWIVFSMSKDRLIPTT